MFWLIKEPAEPHSTNFDPLFLSYIGLIKKKIISLYCDTQRSGGGGGDRMKGGKTCRNMSSNPTYSNIMSPPLPPRPV
jgi:hypothetical protein